MECKRDLTNAYRNSLTKAQELGVRCVAFAAISTGVYAYPFKDATEVGSFGGGVMCPGPKRIPIIIRKPTQSRKCKRGGEGTEEEGQRQGRGGAARVQGWRDGGGAGAGGFGRRRACQRGVA